MYGLMLDGFCVYVACPVTLFRYVSLAAVFPPPFSPSSASLLQLGAPDPVTPPVACASAPSPPAALQPLDAPTPFVCPFTPFGSLYYRAAKPLKPPPPSPPPPAASWCICEALARGSSRAGVPGDDGGEAEPQPLVWAPRAKRLEVHTIEGLLPNEAIDTLFEQLRCAVRATGKAAGPRLARGLARGEAREGEEDPNKTPGVPAPGTSPVVALGPA